MHSNSYPQPTNYFAIAKRADPRLAERIRTAGNRRLVLAIFIVLLKDCATPGSSGRSTGKQCLEAAWLIAD